MNNIDLLLKTIEARLNIHTVQQLLREANLISARSWSELKMIIKGAAGKNPKVIESLVNALCMQQACDLKAVSYFELGENVSDLIYSKLKKFSVPKGELSSSYPFVSPEDELRRDDGKLKPVAKFEDENGAGLVLSRRRTFTTNNEISREHFTENVKEAFPEAEKIIEVKTYDRQTFDVIYLNLAAGVLEIRADTTREHGMPQTTSQIDTSVSDLRFYTRRLAASWVPGFDLDAPLNLLPLAKGVYGDKSGAIKKVGFSTETESVKRETMKAGVDLRDELFHKNGAQAIDHRMAIFEIAIQWHRADIDDGNSKPELYIPGSHRDYVKIGARTDYLLVKGMRVYDDSNFILKKILSYKR
ncbi:hypothetical protein [Pseudomonas aeruginosa]|uniref:hypothetical protein n=1 Tax=Pseudomonas aeruginosa TaxID=287 RepID=UPI001114B038|nr:hypothetical protein [Pseudomonas aeruginosa]MED8000573.1 hypothetical protein [Pseudomonas aeruginosa]